MYVTQTDYADAKLDFGVIGDGIVDDTVKLQAAFDSHKTVGLAPGRFLTSAPLVCSTPSQNITGSGRCRSTFLAKTGFTGASILKFTSGEEGPRLSNLGMTCQVPGATIGITAVNTPRFDLNDLRITLCSVSINMTGNCGGANISRIESWATVNNFVIDGSLDAVFFDRVRVWPFDDPSYAYMGATGWQVGRCDGFMMSQCMTICLNAVSLHAGVDGHGAFGMISACEFDTYNGINMSAGDMVVANNYFSGGSGFGYTCTSNISMTGGSMNVTGNRFYNAVSTVVGVNGGDMQFVGNKIEGDGNPNPFLTQSGGDVICSSNRFNRTSGIVTNYGMVTCLGGRITCIGNRCPIDGTGKFIRIDHDEWHIVTGNRPGGWTNSFPSPGFGIYTGN